MVPNNKLIAGIKKKNYEYLIWHVHDSNMLIAPHHHLIENLNR